MPARRSVYKVAAAMIVVKVPGSAGGEVYLRRGRVLPETVDTVEAKRLAGLGLVTRVETADVPDGDDPAVAQTGQADQTAAK